MRIAAIFIKSHEYLFTKPQTINFGGKYFYSFEIVSKTVIVKRKINEKFIENFFDCTNLDSKITGINAIAGQNGAGKSSILDIIRSGFVKQNFAMPQFESLILIEDDKENYPIILKSEFNNVILQLSEGDKAFKRSSNKIALKHYFRKGAQTIYYSPHFDNKFNPNFDDIDNHDISFDRMLEIDLKELNDKDTNESGWNYKPNQELLFKNSLRQIEFLSSDLVNKQKIFKDLFQLPNHGDPILVFRGYREKERDWNTPTGLRSGLILVKQKIDKEIESWHKIREFKNDKITNQVEVNKYLLKRYIIGNLISLLYKQMEKENHYLFEGEIHIEILEEKTKNLDAYRTFLFFIKNSRIKINKSSRKILDLNNVKNLIDSIYKAIDKVTDEDLVTKTILHVSSSDAINILNLQREFLRQLYRYYHLFQPNDKIILSENDRIEEFVNYMPFTKRLSSGENALLNLFSQLYSFINSNLKKENRFYTVADHYFLLLDEADLSFHPSWKRKYVKALIQTIPYFFNELENKPSLQIIFTTHDPLSLSNLPNANVIYIERRSYHVKPRILDYNDTNRPTKTFGANISDLLADSFFVEDSLIGDFAYDKINETIKWLNEKNKFDDFEYHRKLILLIDEPIIQRKLAEMFDHKMKTKLQINVIDEQIEKLENLKNKLK